MPRHTLPVRTRYPYSNGRSRRRSLKPNTMGQEGGATMIGSVLFFFCAQLYSLFSALRHTLGKLIQIRCYYYARLCKGLGPRPVLRLRWICPQTLGTYASQLQYKISGLSLVWRGLHRPRLSPITFFPPTRNRESYREFNSTCLFLLLVSSMSNPLREEKRITMIPFLSNKAIGVSSYPMQLCITLKTALQFESCIIVKNC